MKRCGYVALLGRPNAGKSTLLNALLGAKVSVVSSKPQTTRNRILGVFTEAENQLLFLDTPGMHKSEGLPRIHKAMNRAAWAAIEDASISCYLVDCERGWHEDDSRYFQGVLERAGGKVAVLLTKIDRIKKEEVALSDDVVAGVMSELASSHPELAAKFAQKVPYWISSKRPEEVKELRSWLGGFMPESPWLYAEDDLTDRPQQFICGEIVREQLFRQLGQELPYNCGVKVESFQDEGKLVRIRALIIVERDSHKGMVIGKGASRLREIGTEARKGLEKHLDKKVHLDLFVKVQEGWLDDERLLAEYAMLESEG
jgi:GTP-binding protein Era